MIKFKALYTLVLSAALTALLITAKTDYAADNILIYTGDFQSGFSDSTDEEQTKEILAEFFNGYLKIKNSLSINDSVTAQTQAIKLLDEVQGSYDKLSKSKILKNWELFVRYAPEAKSRIANTNSLTEQRFFFGILSNYIIDFAKHYGIKNKTVYILQCNDKSILGSGKWLSDSVDGKNPFLGPANENCIEIVETKMAD